MAYEIRVAAHLAEWERKLLKPPGLLERAAKKLGDKVNEVIPQKVHDALTATVKAIVRTSLFGAEYTPKREVAQKTLEEADEESQKLLGTYKKVAAAEGAGTGAGGFILAAADFPALIAIKMKFLFELAHLYGFDTRDFSERIFILNIFQLTFSGPEKRKAILGKIKDWQSEKTKWSREKEFYNELDWEQFQKEYRDAIDFRKMLQFIPGLGAVAGAWANYSILEELGENGVRCFQIRRMQL